MTDIFHCHCGHVFRYIYVAIRRFYTKKVTQFKLT